MKTSGKANLPAFLVSTATRLAAVPALAELSSTFSI